MAGTNIVNADRISKSWGTRTVLSEVSLGLSTGDVIGVVGRNGDGPNPYGSYIDLRTGKVIGTQTKVDGKEVPGVIGETAKPEVGQP